MNVQIKVYVRVNGKNAAFFVGTDCPDLARHSVSEHLKKQGISHGAVLAVVK